MIASPPICVKVRLMEGLAPSALNTPTTLSQPTVSLSTMRPSDMTVTTESTAVWGK